MNAIKERKKYSQRQERRAAKDLGAKVEANSGATRFGGADGRKVNELRIECKLTDSQAYTIKLEDLEKLRKTAIFGGLELPIFQIEFRKHGLKYALIPLRDDWFVGPSISTGKKSLKLQVNDIKGFTALWKEKSTDAIMRIGFWKENTLNPERQYLLFYCNDYLEKYNNENIEHSIDPSGAGDIPQNF